MVLVGSLDFFESHESELKANSSLLLAKLSNGKLTGNRRSDDDVICQCVAIDFLPTPAKTDKLMPVVVKRLTFTRSNVYVPQVSTNCSIHARTQTPHLLICWC